MSFGDDVDLSLREKTVVEHIVLQWHIIVFYVRLFVWFHVNLSHAFAGGPWLESLLRRRKHSSHPTSFCKPHTITCSASLTSMPISHSQTLSSGPSKVTRVPSPLLSDQSTRRHSFPQLTHMYCICSMLQNESSSFPEPWLPVVTWVESDSALVQLNGIMMSSFVVGQCTNNLHYGCSTLSLWFCS